MKHEKDFQVAFGKWARQKMFTSAAYELKFTKGKSIPFSAVAEHQKNALMTVKHGKAFYKIPDAGFQNPFDCFTLVEAQAYVVVMFYEPRTAHEFYLIDIDIWVREEAESSRKSLTREQAYLMATCIGVI